MPIRRWVQTPLVFALLASAAVSFTPVLAQQKNQKQDKLQQQEVQAAVKLADAIAAGQPVANDFGMAIHTDYLKALNGLTFVPFVLSLDPAQVQSKSVTVYLRLVAKNQAASSAPAAAAPNGGSSQAKDKPKDGAAAQQPEYAFQGVHFIDLKTPAAGEPYRLTRAFSVPAGDYDLYIIVKDRAVPGSKDKNAGQKAGFLKQPITVPNLWGADLTTSSVIVAEDLKPLEKPPTAEQITEQPYTIGNNVVVPASTTKMSKKSDLALVFLIYNTAQDAARKPDVAVDYGFYQRLGDKTEKFFNKTQTQIFSAATLPPQFDMAAGHNLLATQSVPLATFPEGEYRLEIKITDKLSGKVISRNIMFSVVT